MKKKLQVFVSSTYEDLLEERQSAVQAILNSGHIPAGMELFTAGDESQKETIKKWIDESDIYLLILGGRYGTLDKSTGKSYTHWEYEYAEKVGKPRFAVVIKEEVLEEKIKLKGTKVMEKENPALYNEFRLEVLSKVCKFYSDIRDIQLAIFQKLAEYAGDENLIGWVYGKDVPNVNDISSENVKLRIENEKLKSQIDKFKKEKKDSLQINGIEYEQLKSLLKKKEIIVPKSVTEGEEIKSNILTEFIMYNGNFAIGVTNQSVTMNELRRFLYSSLAPKLMVFGLLEKVKVAGVLYEKIQTSKNGFKFLQLIEREEHDEFTEVAVDIL